MNADTFFSDLEKDKIQQTIAEIEAGTSGEIAVMLVNRSDSYPEGNILGGVLLGTIAALLITHFFLQESLWNFVPLAAVLAAVTGAILRNFPAVGQFFVPKARIEQIVQQRALQAFFEKELYNTRDDTGVLLFLSLQERKIWVLADKGIYEKINPHELQGYISSLAAGIRNGRACEALCDDIRRIGKVLAEHFPIKDDDTNELSNQVIIGS